MSDIGRRSLELREMDELVSMSSPIHSLHPLSKLIVTLFYIFITASFPKYGLSSLAVMMLYPALLFAVSGIPVKTCIHKMRFMLPVVCAVGILNPFFDRAILLQVGTVNVTGGVISMVTLIVKGILCLAGTFLLAATTSIDAICAALRKMHMPGMMTTLILLTCRYISVMIDEVSILTTAYMLRAPGQRGIHFSAWGSFLGQLLLRSMDKAQDIYSSMQLRGYCGDFRYAQTQPARFSDIIYVVISVLLFVIFRYTDIARIIGNTII